MQYTRCSGTQAVLYPLVWGVILPAAPAALECWSTADTVRGRQCAAARARERERRTERHVSEGARADEGADVLLRCFLQAIVANDEGDGSGGGRDRDRQGGEVRGG